MIFLLLLFFLKSTNSTLGVDVSQPCSSKGWECLLKDGFVFAIVRCYMSSGKVDPNCIKTVDNAWKGGMKYVDVYLFPCVRCGNGKQQVIDTVNYLKENKTKFGMIWLDIEGKWTGSKSKNRAFFEELVDGVNSTGVHAGVYSNYYGWEEIMGLDYTAGSRFPLWYAHYDNNPSFSDFKSFSGWLKPNIKQWHGTKYTCGCGIDENWYP